MSPPGWSFRLAAALVLLAFVAACRPPVGVGHAAAPPPDQGPGTDRPYVHGADLGIGAVRVVIRWPARQAIQGIPPSAELLTVELYKAGATKSTQAVARERPPGDQASTTSITLDKIPIGDYRVVVTARDKGGRIVASASAPLIVLPNQLNRVHLQLQESVDPAITGLGVVAAAPGQRVPVFGRGFGEGAGSAISVSLADVALTAGAVERITDSMIIITIPLAAKTGKVKVKVGDKEASSPADLAIIARLDASPSVAYTHEPAGIVRFDLRAFDAGGAELSSDGQEWIITDMECEFAGPCNEVILPGPEKGIFVGDDEGFGEQAGTATIRVGTEIVNDTVTVVTRTLTPSTLPGDVGPLGPVPYPADNEPTQARSDLGRKLFFDPKLSRKGDMSCATCHVAEKGFGDGRAKGLGNDGADLPRNTPTALNAAYFPRLFWDGRAADLEEQALGVIGAPREFDSDLAALVVYVTSQYGAEFQAAYGAEPTVGLVTKAIASFERRVLVTGDSPFDRWAKGDQTALSPRAKVGMALFLGKSACVSCHGGPLLSDGKFHNIGIPGSGTTDLGRGAITQLASDSGRFKTPTLRNIALTGPYMHDGSRATLADAIRFYENFDEGFANLDPLMVRANFSTDMLAFLDALTSPAVTP